MGIKFQCPACGKGLNVKSNLAGKRGLCPHCRGRVQIPAESDSTTPPAGSTSTASRTDVRVDAQVDARASAPRMNAPRVDTKRGSVSTTAAESRAGGSAAPQVFENLTFENLAVEELTSPSFRLERPQVELEAPRGNYFDWIADAPEAVWYVRNRAGGQYGPAVGSVMRTWLQESRVSRECYVWREGWAHWRQASDVFPHLFELRTHGQPPQLPSAVGTSGSTSAARSERSVNESPEADQAASENERSSRQGNSTALFVAIVLLVLTLSAVAIGTVVYFLPRNTLATPATDPDAPIELRDPFADP